MNITIINDCRDANAAGRQLARIKALTRVSATFVGVSSDIEAAGNLIDIIDAHDDNEGVIIVNVAPRNGAAKRWENGTPFGYFKYKNLIVLSSIDGSTLSLIKKLGLTDAITVLPLPETLDQLIARNALSPELKEYIVQTQFRSFDYLPRVAAFLCNVGSLSGEELKIEEIAGVPNTIWFIDNFGNCKTTLIERDIENTKTLVTSAGTLTRYNRLKDVPDQEAALITGSSGLPGLRFLEIVVQGGSAAEKLGLKVGTQLF